MYTIVVSYTRNDHLYENFRETSGHVELPPSVIPLLYDFQVKVYTIVVSYTRNDHLYESFRETSGHVELPPSVIPPSPHKEKIYHASALEGQQRLPT